MTLETLERPTTSTREDAPRIVHLAPPPYEKSYCGKPRMGIPLKPGAQVTCVVCAELRAAA